MKGNAFLERSTGDGTTSTELENGWVLSVPRREARLTGLFSTQINFLPGDHKFHNEEKYCDQKSFFLGGNRAINLSPNLFAEIGIFLISNQERSEF